MSLILLSCHGGHLVLPDHASLLATRENGGNLVDERTLQHGLRGQYW